MVLNQYYLFYLAQRLAGAINEHSLDQHPGLLNKLYRIWQKFEYSGDRITMRDESAKDIIFIENLPDYLEIFEVDEKQQMVPDEDLFFNLIPLASMTDMNIASIGTNQDLTNVDTMEELIARVNAFNEMEERRHTIYEFSKNPYDRANQLNIIFRVLPYAKRDGAFIARYFIIS